MEFGSASLTGSSAAVMIGQRAILTFPTLRERMLAAIGLPECREEVRKPLANVLVVNVLSSES